MTRLIVTIDDSFKDRALHIRNSILELGLEVFITLPRAGRIVVRGGEEHVGAISSIPGVASISRHLDDVAATEALR